MNFLGIGSGLDLSTMLTQLVQVASEPKVKQLGAKEVEARDSISGLGTLSSLLSKFQDASDELKNASVYDQRKVSIAQPSSGDLFSVTADSSAVVGSYDIKVLDLAQGTKGFTNQISVNNTDTNILKDALNNTIASDTLTLSLADGSNFSVAIDSSMSLDDIRDVINDASDNIGVTANVVDGKLVYNSTVTGDPATKQLKVLAGSDTRFNFELDGAGNVLQGNKIQSAQQAQLEIDGISVLNDSNVFSTQITGLTITALSENATDSAVLDISLDTDTVSSKVNDFASAYNALREGMNTLKGKYDEDGNFTPGKLNGDPLLRNLESMLGSMLTQQVSGAASGMDTLYSVGLDIQSDGTLSVDSDRLANSLDSNFSDFKSLFSGTTGLAYTLSEQLDSYLGFTGIIQGKEDSYNQIIDDLEAQYDAHTRYIESYQKTLKMQFSALDSTMAKLNSTMSYIGPQLAALANIKVSSNS